MTFQLTPQSLLQAVIYALSSAGAVAFAGADAQLFAGESLDRPHDSRGPLLRLRFIPEGVAWYTLAGGILLLFVHQLRLQKRSLKSGLDAVLV